MVTIAVVLTACCMEAAEAGVEGEEEVVTLDPARAYA